MDSTLKEQYPDDARWDYALGHQPTNRDEQVVGWVEVHPASAGEINVVLAKLQWLKTWLHRKAPSLHALRREFIWVSSAKTSFTLTAPQQK